MNFLQSFSFVYLPTFTLLGWLSFLSLNIPVRENLVKAFLSNARFEHNDEDEVVAIYFFLMGHELNLSPIVLADLFDFPNKGETKEHHTPPSIKTQNDKATLLHPQDQYLHILFTHVLQPYGTQHCIISQADYWWIHMIRNGHRPNLTYFIFLDIIRNVHRVIAILHAMHLNHFFEVSGIDLFCDFGIHVSQARYIGSKTMTKIGYVVKRGSLVSKRQVDVPPLDEKDENEDEQPMDTDMPPPPLPSASTTSDIIGMFTSIQGSLTCISQRLDTMDQWFKTFDSRLTAIEEYIHRDQTNPSDN